MYRTASLPMYNLPGMRAANAAFWQALSGLLREEGVADAPEQLAFDRSPVPDRIGEEVLFTQTCGYPLQTVYRGQYTLLARPCYEAPGCQGSTHSAFIVVPAGSAFRGLEDLRGGRFALNSRHSNSGMNLPRRLFADLAGGRPFFSEVVETGGHGASMKLVAAGAADAASIDCLTYVFAQDYAPESVAGLRVLAQTPPSPSIPFVTSHLTDPAAVQVLKRSLERMSADPAFRPVLAPLRIARIEAAGEEEYSALLRYGREASDLGYPDLA